MEGEFVAAVFDRGKFDVKNINHLIKTVVIIIALHISISNEHIHEKGLMGITNAYSENLISITNNGAEYNGLKAMEPNPVNFTLI